MAMATSAPSRTTCPRASPDPGCQSAAGARSPCRGAGALSARGRRHSAFGFRVSPHRPWAWASWSHGCLPPQRASGHGSTGRSLGWAPCITGSGGEGWHPGRRIPTASLGQSSRRAKDRAIPSASKVDASPKRPFQPGGLMELFHASLQRGGQSGWAPSDGAARWSSWRRALQPISTARRRRRPSMVASRITNASCGRSSRRQICRSLAGIWASSRWPELPAGKAVRRRGEDGRNSCSSEPGVPIRFPRG